MLATQWPNCCDPVRAWPASSPVGGDGGDCENLHLTIHLAVDEIERKNAETHAANGRRMNNTIPARRLTNGRHDSTKLSVIALAKTSLLVFIVSDLPAVLCRRTRV